MNETLGSYIRKSEMNKQSFRAGTVATHFHPYLKCGEHKNKKQFSLLKNAKSEMGVK